MKHVVGSFKYSAMHSVKLSDDAQWFLLRCPYNQEGLTQGGMEYRLPLTRHVLKRLDTRYRHFKDFKYLR